MQLVVHMHLESDAIFGNGMSMPGGEDICMLTDPDGFPYLKGSTFKGIFREELENYLFWQDISEQERKKTAKELMGEGGFQKEDNLRKLIFSELTLHPGLIQRMTAEKIPKQEIIDAFTYLRTFTGLENGMVKEGSLRTARCVKKGLSFYGLCSCSPQDGELVKDILRLMKWVGTMRSRGFGKVRIRGEAAEG